MDRGWVAPPNVTTRRRVGRRRRIDTPVLASRPHGPVELEPPPLTALSCDQRRMARQRGIGTYPLHVESANPRQAGAFRLTCMAFGTC